MNKIIIERDKLEHNIHIIKDKIKDIEHKPKIIAVIKGNGYGLDSCYLAQKLLDFNIDFFAVSEVEEAKKLRDAGFSNEILLLESTCILEEIDKIVEYNLTATLGSIDAVLLLNNKAEENNKIIKAHLKIDTGFSRFGFIINDDVALKIKNTLDNCNNIKITGTYSHFMESYSNNNIKTEEQYNKFISDVDTLNKIGINTGMLHICNSSAFFKYPNMYLDAVRIGSAFTGRMQIKNATGLKRVGFLQSEICEIKDLVAGSKIGYSGTCKINRDTKIAIVGAGYEAGVGVSGPKDKVRFIDKLRNLKSSILCFTKNEMTYVEVNGVKCPILGRIGMKNFVIDITDCNAKVGDKVNIQINIIFANPTIERQEL